MNECDAEDGQKKGGIVQDFFSFSFFFCASHCVMADLVPEEERKH